MVGVTFSVSDLIGEIIKAVREDETIKMVSIKAGGHTQNPISIHPVGRLLIQAHASSPLPNGQFYPSLSGPFILFLVAGLFFTRLLNPGINFGGKILQPQVLFKTDYLNKSFFSPHPHDSVFFFLLTSMLIIIE